MIIIIPAAGEGQRFKDAGYDLPKPLIDVCGKPMLQRVIENLRPSQHHRFVIVSRMHHAEVAPFLGDDDIAIHIPYQTEGAIDTLLHAKHQATYEPLLVGNCDQLCKFNVDDFIASARGSDGAFVTFKSANEHHSYVTVDHSGAVQTIAEKEVISPHAMAGVYYFTHGLDFIVHCQQVIAHNERVANGEFYLSSAIKRMIDAGRRFVTYDAPSFMLGTPMELQAFETAIRIGKDVLL